MPSRRLLLLTSLLVALCFHASLVTAAPERPSERPVTSSVYGPLTGTAAGSLETVLMDGSVHVVAHFFPTVKADVSCPENTEVRCPLFTDVRVRRITPQLPPPRGRRPAWACARAGPPSSSHAAGSCRL